MTQQFALSFLRDGSDIPAYSLIPADTSPAIELQAFFTELDRNHIDHSETDEVGVYTVRLMAGQDWSVRIVRVGDDDEDTQKMPPVDLGEAS